MTSRKTYFLIAGNTRVGSTWLQTSLDALNDVACRREIRFKMAYHATPEPMHLTLNSESRSFKPLIDIACSGRQCATVGARLKLDPYYFLDSDSIRFLHNVLDPDIAFVLLRRSYFEIFQTWKSREITQRLNHSRDEKLPTDHALVERIEKMEADAITPRRFILVDGTAPLSPEDHPGAIPIPSGMRSTTCSSCSPTILSLPCWVARQPALQQFYMTRFRRGCRASRNR